MPAKPPLKRALSPLKRALTEPLAHFMVIGAVIFLLYEWVGTAGNDSSETITLSATDISAMAEAWQLRWNRPPAPAELHGLVEDHIREQVMYREALKLGLDKNDSIVRRRMAQKLDFLFRDLTQQIEPGDQQLMDYLEATPERFITPARFSFVHVYLSPDKRGARVEADAIELLESLSTLDVDEVDPTAAGDRFMLQHELIGYSLQEVSRLMGARFAEAVEEIAPGSWQGPVNSGYGLHLVYVRDRTPPVMPAFESIRDKVLMEYVSEQQRDANEALYQEFRNAYQVSVDWPAEFSNASGAGGSAALPRR